MEYYGSSSKLQKILGNERLLVKHYGKLKAEQIGLRLQEFTQAKTLAEIRTLPPTKLHGLKGDRKNQFAVNISPNWRMIFEGYNADEVQSLKKDEIITLLIVEIEDYH